MLQERHLHRIQLIALRQTFYCGDLIAFMRDGEREATIDATPIG